MSELLLVLTSAAFWWTFVLVSCIPYAMILVGVIFESRLPGNGPSQLPIWKGQSKALFPGDLGLALTVSVCLQYRNEVTFPSPWIEILFAAGCLAVALTVFKVARSKLYTPKDYTRGQWHSPTKIWHDFVMFFMFTAAALYICLPVLFTGSTWSDRWAVYLFGLSGLLLWILCNVYDFFINPEGIDKMRQHPDTHTPIWSRTDR